MLGVVSREGGGGGYTFTPEKARGISSVGGGNIMLAKML